MMIGLAYALGHALNNPRLNVWAKGEIYQVFISVLVVVLILFMNDSFCSFRYSSLSGLAPGGAENYTNPSIPDDAPMFEAAKAYLMNLGTFASETMRSVRSANGLMEISGRYTRSPCVPPVALCLLGQNSLSVRPYSGSTLWAQVGGTAMYVNTISYFTVLIQIAFLEFITTRGIYLFLPLAIIFRSLPFMRQLGGGLIAISLAVLLLYPALLVAESLFWNPYSMLAEGDMNLLQELSGGETEGVEGLGVIGWNYYTVADRFLPVLRASSIAFLSSTFLFTFNIIAISAAAREFGRLLGQEVDLSRLAQIL